MTTAKRDARALLKIVDDALAGWSCCNSADCCRFASSGREPWLTPAEWRVVVAEVKRQGRRVPAPREDGDCAFLDDGDPQRGARCTIYEARPLGCRTFYCDRASGDGAFPRALVRDVLRDLENGTKDARPLTSWLRTAR